MSSKKKNMTKLFFIAVSSILIVGIIFSFIGKQSKEVQHLASTDLSDISVDLIKIGVDINEIDLSKYQKSNRFKNKEGEYAYYFNELVIGLDENKVNYLFAFNADVAIVINNKNDLSTIDEITDVLGSNYIQQTEDGEQRLLKHIYKDTPNGIVAEFVYSGYDGQFVWITLRNIR